jgi:predicted Zn-dependent peptidase
MSIHPDLTGVLPENYFHHTFANGLELVGQRMPGVNSLCFGIQFPAGAQEEPEDQLGLTHLLEYMMFQGTVHRNVRQITEAFESLGARHWSDANAEWARYAAQIVYTKFVPTLELMADIVRYPAFPEAEFNQMKSVVLQEIRRRQDEPMRRIFDLVRSHFFIGSTLGRPLLGTHESVSALTPDDLRAFWRARYQPAGALISIAGKFDWDAVVAQFADQFHDWNGPRPTSTPQHPQPRSKLAIERVDGTQEHIGLALPFATYGDPDYYAAVLAAEILGGGMTSRLFAEVREKRGLVYAVSASFSPNAALGAMLIYAGTTPEKAQQTLSVILTELHRLEQDGVTEDELRRAKVQVKSEVVMRGESSAARMAAIARSWWYERRLIPIQETKARIDAVTTEQIQGLLHRFPLTRTIVIGAIGPCSEEELTRDIDLPL